MKPVDQTTFGEVGNCFSACIASLLELPLDDVPYFMGAPEGSWWDRFKAWCETRDLWPAFMPKGSPAPKGYSILGGPSPRHAERLHACIGFDGALVHDPNPARTGLVEIQDYIVLLPIMPRAAAAAKDAA